MRLNRRTLLAAASLAAAPSAAWARGLSTGTFSHGVASGDPLPDGVVIWTRFVSLQEGRIGWEVAEDEAFTQVRARGETQASFASDFCAKVDVRGLAPGRRYFYRFLSAGGPSETGLTRTAPQGDVGSLNVAFFSCANYGFGYFHAYAHAAAREDIDLVLHLGDYIYEVQRGVYPGPDELVPGRIIDPTNETVSLSDYYQRYAVYHTDPGLLELRRVKPMSVVWDDHEIANDTYKDGAQQHQEETEGPWANRIAAATKAYFDWMPIRRPESRGYRIYRALDWGNLARIVLLDTRYIGRDKQANFNALADAMNAPGADEAAVVNEFRRSVLDDPSRSMLGQAQEAWFDQTLASSKAMGQTWQVIAQQVVVSNQLASESLASLLSPATSAGSRRWFETGARLSRYGLSWNFDNWNGYPKARERFLNSCAANAANAIVLGGDSHNCWVHNIAAAQGDRLAALEYAGGSVASPGFERSLTQAQPGQRETAMRQANPDMAFCDVTNRGYGSVKLTREGCEAQWLAFNSTRSSIAAPPAVTRFTAGASAGAGPGRWAV